MKRTILILVALIATAPASQAAGPIRNALREWRESRAARKASPCPPCQAQQPAMAAPLFSRPLLPAVAASQPVQSLRGLFGVPGGCPGGACPAK